MYTERTEPSANGRKTLSAIFISDTHLLHPRNGAASIHLRSVFGAKGHSVYAVGDTFDLEAVDAALYRLDYEDDQFPTKIEDVLRLIEFPDLETHLRVVDTMMARAEAGDKVRLITGNHDIALDLLDGENLGGLGICNSTSFVDGAGRRFVVEHGHMLDPGFLQDYKGMYKVGNAILDTGLWADHKLGDLIPPLKYEFHISNNLKKIGKIYVNGFVDRAMERAKSEGADGIICGHIHKQAFTDRVRYTLRPGIRNEGALYINCGDGLTHGTSVVHTGGSRDDDWFLQSPKHIPDETRSILSDENPYAEFRPRSMDMLQTLWSAHLERKLNAYAQAEPSQHVIADQDDPFPETVAATVPARELV